MHRIGHCTYLPCHRPPLLPVKTVGSFQRKTFPCTGHKVTAAGMQKIPESGMVRCLLHPPSPIDMSIECMCAQSSLVPFDVLPARVFPIIIVPLITVPSQAKGTDGLCTHSHLELDCREKRIHCSEERERDTAAGMQCLNNIPSLDNVWTNHCNRQQ